MRESIVNVLMKRDGLTKEAAVEQVKECQAELMERIQSGDSWSAMDICEEFFGLEPDYLDELIY